MDENNASLRGIARVSGPANLVWSEDKVYTMEDLSLIGRCTDEKGEIRHPMVPPYLRPEKCVTRRFNINGVVIDSVHAFIGLSFDEENNYERKLFYFSQNGSADTFKLRSVPLHYLIAVKEL